MPAGPGSPVYAGAIESRPARRIAASFCPSGDRNSASGGPAYTETHVGDTCRELPLRSKPEGVSPAGPGSRTTYFLLLSMLVLLRVVRCRDLPGQTADDAVLTLLFLNLLTRRGFSQS